MSNPNVYEVAHLKDADGALIRFGVDYDFVTIDCGRAGTGGGFRLNRAQAELFAQYFLHAVWEAGASDWEPNPDPGVYPGTPEHPVDKNGWPISLPVRDMRHPHYDADKVDGAPLEGFVSDPSGISGPGITLVEATPQSIAQAIAETEADRDGV